MRRSGAFILSACLSASRILSVYAKGGALWCGTLMCVDAVIRGNIVSYEMKALNQLGWMAIGFGTSMNNNTPVVVMWLNGNEKVTLSQRLANGHVEPHPDSNPAREATISKHKDISSATSPILAFDMPNSGSTVQSLIWAFGVTSPNSTDPSAHIEQHLDAGTFTLDLSKTDDDDDNGDDDDDNGGANTTSDLSASATSAPSSSAVVLSTAAGSSSSIPTDSPHTSSSPAISASSSSLPALPSAIPAHASASLQSHHTILVAHAVLCFLGFAIFLPLSAVAARWGRTATSNWFRIHWITIVALGLPTMLPGWALGPLLVSRERHKHVVNEHQIVGVVVFAMCILQMSVGTFIRLRSPSSNTKTHPPRNIVHILSGLTIIGLALYETFTGISRTIILGSTTKRMLTIGCALWATAVIVAYLAGLTRLRRQLDQERLGWHLPAGSPARGSPLALLRRSNSSSRPPRCRTPPLAREGSDDDLDGLFRNISSSGPTSHVETRAPSIIEMREVQRPLPISVRY